MSEYLYAIAERLPRGWCPPADAIGLGPATARRVGDLAVISSTVETVPVASPRSLAVHHDVVASTMSADAVLPFRFGATLPPGQLDDWLDTRRGLVQTALDHVRGCVEMSVKLLRLDSESATARPASRRAAAEAANMPPGLIQLRALAERLVERAGIETWSYRPSGPVGNVAASVAFLVPRAEVPVFLTRIAPVASHAVGIAVVPTGPWPAYSFVPALDRGQLARVTAQPAADLERRAG
jgi:hypothetical protein